MKKFYIFTFPIIVLFFSYHLTYSQLTGSFSINVNIVTGTRVICFYVPTNYDSTKDYSVMLCLHGAGQPADSYRDNLAVPLAPYFPNTIWACPEGGGPSGDFYYQTGDETIIDSTLNYLKSNYSIDEKQIILQGFSLGGRSALKYGLEHPDLFKGLFLNTPAIQSNLEANNNPMFNFKYKYENGTKIPIAITHGSTDAGYYHIIDTVFKRLTDANALVYFVRVVGLGHSIPNITILQKCMDFINQPLKNSLDADITNIMPPERIYEKHLQPSFRMRNFGQTDITSALISYSINGVMASDFEWTGSLSSFDKADIVLPDVQCQENFNTLTVQIKNINGQNANPALSIKKDSADFQCLTQNIALPLNFGFEFTQPSDDFWNIHFSGGMWTWSVYSDTKTEGSYALCMYNMPFVNINRGLSEDLLSPVVDLTTVNNPCLAYDYAFDYIYLTPPDYNNYYTFTDTMKILMSLDNGSTFTEIYSKTGSSLATVSTPITNPASLNDCIFVPSSVSQWKKDEVVRLNDYSSASKAIFIFKYVSGIGGTIWLDNIRFMSYDNLNGISEQTDCQDFRILPNPASDFMNIKLPDNASLMNIISLSGENICTRKINSGEKEIFLNTGGMNSGIYLVELTSGDKIFRQKLMIVK